MRILLDGCGLRFWRCERRAADCVVVPSAWLEEIERSFCWSDRWGLRPL